MLRHKNVLDYLSVEYSCAPLPNSSHTHSSHTLTHPSSRPTTRIPSSFDVTMLVTPVLANAADSRRASSKSATRNRPRKRFLCRPHSVLYHQAPPKSQCPSSTSTSASFGTLTEYPGGTHLPGDVPRPLRGVSLFSLITATDLWPLASNFLVFVCPECQTGEVIPKGNAAFAAKYEVGHYRST